MLAEHVKIRIAYARLAKSLAQWKVAADVARCRQMARGALTRLTLRHQSTAFAQWRAAAQQQWLESHQNDSMYLLLRHALLVTGQSQYWHVIRRWRVGASFGHPVHSFHQQPLSASQILNLTKAVKEAEGRRD